MLHNLIRNAVDAMKDTADKDRGITVRARLTADDEVELAVARQVETVEGHLGAGNGDVDVQVVAYELQAAQSQKPPEYEPDAPLATSGELEHFYTHLEQVLTDLNFLDPDNPRHLMRRLRRLFLRARPDQNEINILRGILTAVERDRGDDQ